MLLVHCKKYVPSKYVRDLRGQFSRKGGNADASLAYDAESCVVCFCLQIPDAKERNASYRFFEGVPFCLQTWPLIFAKNHCETFVLEREAGCPRKITITTAYFYLQNAYFTFQNNYNLSFQQASGEATKIIRKILSKIGPLIGLTMIMTLQ